MQGLAGFLLVAEFDLLVDRHCRLATDPGLDAINLVTGFQKNPRLLFD